MWILFSLIAALLLSGPIPLHYAASTHWVQNLSCSQSWAVSDHRTSLVLDLNPAGKAAACRSKDWRDSGGGHREPATYRSGKEQLRYRGTWEMVGMAFEITLTPDASVCAPVGIQDIKQAKPWVLLYDELTQHPELKLPGAGMVCRFKEPRYTEKLGYKIWKIDGGPAIVLGWAAGFVVEETDEMGGRHTTIRTAQAAITNDEWTHLFVLPDAPQ